MTAVVYVVVPNHRWFRDWVHENRDSYPDDTRFVFVSRDEQLYGVALGPDDSFVTVFSYDHTPRGPMYGRILERIRVLEARR
jgi:hypothetical protein